MVGRSQGVRLTEQGDEEENEDEGPSGTGGERDVSNDEARLIALPGRSESRTLPIDF
jgi:hypothetical protein